MRVVSHIGKAHREKGNSHVAARNLAADFPRRFTSDTELNCGSQLFLNTRQASPCRKFSTISIIADQAYLAAVFAKCFRFISFYRADLSLP